jgi:hypothetical protein
MREKQTSKISLFFCFYLNVYLLNSRQSKVFLHASCTILRWASFHFFSKERSSIYFINLLKNCIQEHTSVCISITYAFDIVSISFYYFFVICYLYFFFFFLSTSYTKRRNVFIQLLPEQQQLLLLVLPLYLQNILQTIE